MTALFKSPKPDVSPPPQIQQADAMTTLGDLSGAGAGASSGAATLISGALERRRSAQRKKTLG